ncbi:hypothetical protein PDK26_13310 [Bacillus cereus]|uniref:hypothetical protein n=1 Tax=Bacillus cereus group sp. BfR-BA-01358 TaxID=2920320 RepID=UPI001F564323|nr:hypothetical protein [Bacillus cereus group sp. BfR-BA-01358]MDA1612204.1 hypothetical protein [Bacillus cereus]MDA2617918.1 hypothetical protein [Bacillus cereus]
MTKGWINKLGMISIGASLALSVGCTPQDKEAVAQKEEKKAQKQAEKEAEKQRKQQEKDAKEENKRKEKDEKKKQAEIDKEVSETKGTIRKLLMNTDKTIADLKKSSANGGKLSEADTKMLSGDLKLVLEHVGDIKGVKGETDAIKTYEAKLNDYIQSFEKGEERDIKELIRDIKSL